MNITYNFCIQPVGAHSFWRTLFFKLYIVEYWAFKNVQFNEFVYLILQYDKSTRYSYSYKYY